MALASAFNGQPARAAGDAECTGYGELSGNPALALGRVSGEAPRTYFILSESGRAGCPDDAVACRARAFLVRGDTVVMGARRGSLICADYVGPRGRDRAGWLPAAALTVVSQPPVSPANWAGTWSQTEATVTIKAEQGGTLQIGGNASWGSLDPDRVKRGAVNVGEFAAKVVPNGVSLAFAVGADATLPVEKGEEFDCKVWMRRLGPYLLVDDNGNCGGMNVSFRGVYARKR